MEAKTLLKLIKDDLAHLEGITGDFSMESLPLSDEIELALVRATALLRELELLHKYAVKLESISAAVKPTEEPQAEFEAYDQSGEEHFESSESENIDDDQDPNTGEAAYEIESDIEDQQNIEDLPEVKVEEHFSALTEPVELMDNESAVPVISEDEIDNQATDLRELSETSDFVTDSPIIVEEETISLRRNDIETSVDDTIEAPLENINEVVIDQKINDDKPSAFTETEFIPNIQDHKEEILAEEFKEVKKTLNETLGESHQVVNDILSAEKDEAGYKIIPINSIWDGIGINDRFLFIRELFSNSSAQFENTVAALDKLSSIHDAVNYLKMNFKWNKTEASQKFLVLVKRRFTK